MQEIELLKEYKLKVTPQRIAIVELLKEHGHLSIAKMYELMKRRFPTVSLATIYKNIHAMMQSNFINEVKIVGQDSRYELTQPSHSHVVCKECGEIVDVDVSGSSLLKEVSQKTQFKLESSSFVFYGICRECLD